MQSRRRARPGAPSKLLTALAAACLAPHALGFHHPAVSSRSPFSLERHGSSSSRASPAAAVATLVCQAVATAPARTKAPSKAASAASTFESLGSVIEHYGVRPPSAARTRSIGATIKGAQFDTLDAAEEKDALQKVAAAKKLLAIQQHLVTRSGRLPTLQEWAAAAKVSETALQRTIADAVTAKEALVATNIPLVYSIVYKQYSQRAARNAMQVSMRDLVQEGVCGLMHAVELYDETSSKGARLRTYAWFWVKSYIEHGILNNGHAVKVPRRAAESIKASTAALKAQLEREPTDAELATHMKLPIDSLHVKLALARKRVMSLDSPAAEQDLLEEIEQDALGNSSDSSCSSTDADVERSVIGSEVRRAIKTALSAKEQQLLELRYGLLDGQTRTIKECALLSLNSLEMTRRLLESSMAKLRAHILLHNGSLREYASQS